MFCGADVKVTNHTLVHTGEYLVCGIQSNHDNQRWTRDARREANGTQEVRMRWVFNAGFILRAGSPSQRSDVGGPSWHSGDPL